MIWLVIAFWLGGALVSAMELINAEYSGMLNANDVAVIPWWPVVRLIIPAIWPVVVPAGMYIWWKRRNHHCKHCEGSKVSLGSPKACSEHEQLRTEFAVKSRAMSEEHMRLYKIATACPECVNMHKRWLNGDESATVVPSEPMTRETREEASDG